MGKRIIYIGDPMCSWCWGFAPVVADMRRHYAETAPVEIVLGGMRAFETVPMDQAIRDLVREHWSNVNAATGQPFDFDFLERDEFVFDSEPPCRATVAVRECAPDCLWDYYDALHRGFHAANRDVTSSATLAALAEDVGIAGDDFAIWLESDAVRQRTLEDFKWAYQSGITGFPTVVLRDGEEYGVLSVGYRPYDDLAPVLDRWIAGELTLKPH